ncbi:peptide chain release factor N(5)-glutamine methyltransferase [Oceanobacillus piezotolerans]|uniref:Release factor glutamine methyltransferase n=1 Tax=Oceanobacillus piezotolerans TaxID=2448030 RepID=A0A498D6V9_9BACI|nr:peptide chain release factor N(5)-glutamine methyltransferase [Oceanobacillus piezotolerans]RLL42894.1 peptide chain release factor N(5)-glutamine methyltransferase [Oceanobacillus piezotolerans]
MSEKLYEVLKRASLFLEKHNREARVAEILLQHYLQLSRSQFFMNLRELVPEHKLVQFEKDLLLHAETGIPVQHLTGYEMFYGREFHVNKDVLVPRPETEELVQHAISLMENKSNINIVDVGTGSGVIAITLALELPAGANVYAIDISNDALAIAKRNAEKHQADVHFLQGDFLEPLIKEKKKVDLLISNPPYIALEEASEMADTVKNFDPRLALFAEEEGLAAYKRIVKQAREILNPDGRVAFEIGAKQREPVTNIILSAFPEADVECLQDINGKDRIISAKMRLGQMCLQKREKRTK